MSIRLLFSFTALFFLLCLSGCAGYKAPALGTTGQDIDGFRQAWNAQAGPSALPTMANRASLYSSLSNGDQEQMYSLSPDARIFVRYKNTSTPADEYSYTIQFIALRQQNVSAPQTYKLCRAFIRAILEKTADSSDKVLAALQLAPEGNTAQQTVKTSLANTTFIAETTDKGTLNLIALFKIATNNTGSGLSR